MGNELQEQDMGVSPEGAGLSPSVEPVPVSPPSGASIPDAASFKPASYEDKPRHLPKVHGDALNAFLAPMFAKLESMTPEELSRLLDACLKVSPINCGWQQYGVAKLVFWYARDLVAKGIAARSDETANAGSAVGKSPGRKASPNPLGKAHTSA